VIDPNYSINLIHEDLILYKKAYENLIQHTKNDKIRIKNLEKEIKELEFQTEEFYLGKFHDQNYIKQKFKSTKNKTNKKFENFPPQDDSNINGVCPDWLEVIKYLEITHLELEPNPETKISSKILKALELFNIILIEKV